MTQNEKLQIRRRNAFRNLWQKLNGTPDFSVKLALAALYLVGAVYVCVRQVAWRTLAGNIPLLSPLLKAAMGLLGSSGMGTRGDIWFEGKSLPDVPPKEMRRICGEKIGMIFQDCGASLSPTRTIGEQIIESMAAHRKVDVAEAKRAALELFEKLHFQDGERIWDSYPFELSGGMNQRAGIAIAMLMNPAVLLADEPTSALDMAVQRQVVEEMLHVREAFGTAIIIVTHDIGVVSAMADSIVVLSNGRVMEYAAAKDVLENPQNDYTVKLLSAVPRLRREKA